MRNETMEIKISDSENVGIEKFKGINNNNVIISYTNYEGTWEYKFYFVPFNGVSMVQ